MIKYRIKVIKEQNCNTIYIPQWKILFFSWKSFLYKDRDGTMKTVICKSKEQGVNYLIKACNSNTLKTNQVYPSFHFHFLQDRRTAQRGN